MKSEITFILSHLKKILTGRVICGAAESETLEDLISLVYTDKILIDINKHLHSI